ncbi:MAG: hypothetical protein WCV92_05030 [Candidatus Buchananbacteria bacterium]
MPKKITSSKGNAKKSIQGTREKKVAPAKRQPKEKISNTPKYESADDVYYIDNKRYVDASKVDYDQEKKRIYIIAILIPFVIALGVLWFMDLKKNVSDSAKQLSLGGLQAQMENSIDQFKNQFEFDNKTSTDQALTDKQLEEIKNEIINKVKNSTDPTNWPTHESASLGLTVQYPISWTQRDENKLLRLNSSSTVSVSEIIINLKSTAKNTKLNDWIKSNFSATNYKLTSSTNFSVAGATVIQYNNTGTSADEINSIIFFQKNNKIYQVSIKSNDKKSSSGIISNIFKSLKIL